MARHKRVSPLRDEILKKACVLFLERGYTATTIAAISKELDISTGNLTYHFPTKEHLLLDIVNEMCSFQWKRSWKHIGKDASPVLSYALEIAMQTALCEYDDIARDFYVSAYSHPLVLAEIRDWCSSKAKKQFLKYLPEWQEVDYAFAGIHSTGIQLAALLAECNEIVTLHGKIEDTAQSLLKLYNIPEEEYKDAVETVLKMDYVSMGKEMFNDFKKHIENSD